MAEGKRAAIPPLLHTMLRTWNLISSCERRWSNICVWVGHWSVRDIGTPHNSTPWLWWWWCEIWGGKKKILIYRPPLGHSRHFVRVILSNCRDERQKKYSGTLHNRPNEKKMSRYFAVREYISENSTACRRDGIPAPSESKTGEKEIPCAAYAYTIPKRPN